MKKTFNQSKDEIAQLCKYFASNHQEFLAPGIKEAHVRQILIDPFFEALGWDVRNTDKVAPQYREVMIEDSLDVEGHQKAPDYSFRVGTLPKFYTEAKKCGINISADPAPAYQLRRYGWSAKVVLSILTDFEEFSIYDCTKRPNPKDKASYSRLQYYHFEQYPDCWREIWDVFSREAVWSGAFDKHSASKRKRGTSEVDTEFLKEIEGWRDALARNIALRNKDLSSDDLNAAVQRTIDRIVFLRMAEDRGIEPYEQLLKLCERPNIYKRFMSDLCNRADEKYNSGLFHFQKEKGISEAPDQITPRLKVDDKTLKPILKNLYFAHGSPYHFGVLPVEILGTVYERFLGKVIRLTAGHQAKIEEKPEVRKAGGVYYTPSYIVDYIVKNTVGAQIEGKSPKQLAGNKTKEPFRVLDMACGSGSFLLGAYKYLLDHCLKWYIGHSPSRHKKAVYKTARNGQWNLTIQEKKRILTTHIFGVDIDHQAVEVSKLSLLLKVLEGETDQTIGQQMQLFHERALPNLAENIKCGNSLIGPDYFTGRLIVDPDEMQRVNPFDWKQGFPAAMKAGGFDCIIGNPPYLNVDDTWGKRDVRLNALKTLYADIYNDKTDILFYFISKSIQLSKGPVGLIISRAFLEAYKADKLRKHLSVRSSIDQIIDFQNFYVFSGVGITTCIITFRPNKPRKKVNVYKLQTKEFQPSNLSKQLSNTRLFEHLVVQQNTLNSPPWVLASQTISNLNAKIDAIGKELHNILIIGQGMQTGRNNVFGKRTNEDITSWRLKKELFFKRATNSDIQRYFIRNRDEYIVYPQPAKTFNQLPVELQQHLLLHSDELKSRAAYKRGDCEWWKYTWPLHEQYYDRDRIICPYLASSNRFALDAHKEYLSLTDTTVLFENGQAESLLYLLGLLNSKLLNFRFKSIGKLKGGGIYEYFWNSVSRLPIRCIDFSNPKDQAAHSRIDEMVKSMLSLKKHHNSSTSESQREIIQRHIQSTETVIDNIVYELYGLTGKEISIVEDSNH